MATVPKHHLTVAVGQWVPWSDLTDEPDGTISATGVAAEFFKIVVAKLNLTYTLVRSPDGEWGRQMPNGSWTGLIGQCNRNEVDMAMGPLAVTYERNPAVGFSSPLFIDHHGIFLPRPRLEKDLTDVARPLAWQVWIALAISMIVSTILGIIINHIVVEMIKSTNTNISRDNAGRVKPSFSSVWIFRALLNEPAETLPETETGRVFFGTWLIAALIIDTAYSGVLTSLLSVPTVTVPVDALEDLITHGKIRWANEQGSALQQLFADATEGLYKQIHDGELLVESAWDERRNIKNDRIAVLCDMVSMRKVMSYDFSETGLCNYYIAKDPIKSVPLAYTFPKNSWLLPHFNKWLGPLTESGLVARTVHGLTANATACMVSPGKEGGTVTAPFKILDLAGIFLLSALGLLLGFFSLIGELILHQWTHSA